MARHPHHAEIVAHIHAARRGLPADHPAQFHLRDALERMARNDHAGARSALERARTVAASGLREDAATGEARRVAERAARRDAARRPADDILERLKARRAPKGGKRHEEVPPGAGPEHVAKKQKVQESALAAMLSRGPKRGLIEKLASPGPPRDTLEAHLNGGKLSPQRAAVHAGLVERALRHPRQHDLGPVALVAHRTEDGKVHTVKRPDAPVPRDAVHISIPAIRRALPEHPLLKAHPQADEKALTDREARHVAKAAANLALHAGSPVVIHDEPPPDQLVR